MANNTNMSTFDIIASGISLVPQVRNIFPSMTVQENLDISTNAQDKQTDKLHLIKFMRSSQS